MPMASSVASSSKVFISSRSFPRKTLDEVALSTPTSRPNESDSEDELNNGPPPPSSPLSAASDHDSDSDEDDTPRERKPYERKRKEEGPVAEKRFLHQGLYASSTSRGTLVPKVQDQPPAEKKLKTGNLKPTAVYQNTLTDEKVIDGKLDLDMPWEGDDSYGTGRASGGSSTADEAATGARSLRARLRGRMSLPAFLPTPPVTPSLTVVAVGNSLVLPTSLPSLSATLGVFNGTRSRPRASLPSFSKPVKKVSTSPTKPFSFPLPTAFSFPLPQAPHLLGHRQDFKLPYDIQWELENGILRRKKTVRVPGKYKQIVQNTFPERGKDMDPTGPAICNCVLPKKKTEDGCGEGCMNRMMQYLCHPKTCPCGERCSNKSLYKRKSPDIRVFWTGDRGFGLRALEKIPKGTFVIDYRGEIIEISTYYDRILKDYADRDDYYALEYGEGEVIDAGMKGNAARFINHGCSPNLEVHKLTTLGSGVEEYEVGLWASRDIKRGEELFYDYNFDSFGDRPSKPSKPTKLSPTSDPSSSNSLAIEEALLPPSTPGKGRQRCCCGAKACTGWIGGTAAKMKEAKEKAFVDVKGTGKVVETKGKGSVGKTKKAKGKKSLVLKKTKRGGVKIGAGKGKTLGGKGKKNGGK